MVIGTVVEKHGEAYKVDIGTAQPAMLPAIAFEGATKRNRPNIPVGALVYCRVAIANKFMETELTCISVHFKKDWVRSNGDSDCIHHFYRANDAKKKLAFIRQGKKELAMS